LFIYHDLWITRTEGEEEKRIKLTDKRSGVEEIESVISEERRGEEKEVREEGKRHIGVCVCSSQQQSNKKKGGSRGNRIATR
jgi:hypothetical protein